LAIEEISPNVLARSSSSSKDRRPRRRRWGHDYGTIEQKGFRKLCVERDGAVVRRQPPLGLVGV